MNLTKHIDRPEDLYQVHCYTFEDSVGYLIKRCRLALSLAIDREMAQFDISHDQWGILIMISKGAGDTAAELSREMGCDTGSMTRMIDRLEAKGLVARTRCANDRRVVRLALTDSGQDLAAKLPHVMVNVLNRHLDGFSKDELEQFKLFLRRMMANAAAEEKKNHGVEHPRSASHAARQPAEPSV